MKNLKKLSLLIVLSVGLFACDNDNETNTTTNERNITKKTGADITYTVNSDTSFFDSDKLFLNIFLPAETAGNPYEFTTFDISQTINGKTVNAVFVYMKKQTDTDSDLSDNDDDKTVVNYTTQLADLNKLQNLPDLQDFNSNNTGTVVIVYHDSSNDFSHKTTCAEKAFTLVPTAYNDVISNGNFQGTVSLMGGDPKKTGTSLVPRKS